MEVLRDGASTLATYLNNNVPSARQLLQLSLALNPFSTPHSQSSQQSTTSSPEIIQQTCPQLSRSCPINPPSSIDTCCLNHPSGHFLLAQFWDTQPALGPSTSWTLHGLWPDLCTGGYDAYCDRTRNLQPATISRIIDAASQSTHPGLRAYMDGFWKGLHGDDDLWSHEWNKHGTCVSTIEPKCYNSSSSSSSSSSSPTPPSSTSHADLLDYFQAATSLHFSLQTYTVLASHDITPSETKTYTLSAIQAALEFQHGFIGTVKCNSRHELNEIWMHYNVLGPLRNCTDGSGAELFEPTKPDGLKSNCPATGIRYLPKRERGGGPKPPGPTGRPGGKPFEGRGYLRVRVVSDGQQLSSSSSSDSSELFNEGCLIRQGFWYTSGQCATYRAKTDVIEDHRLPVVVQQQHTTGFEQSGVSSTGVTGGLFTLASSYAPCAFLEADGKQGRKGEFVCANHLPVQSIFGSEDGLLSWKGQKVFWAERVPGRFEKVRVYGDDGDGERKVKLEIWWEGI